MTGLALLARRPDAADWVKLTTGMFEEKLLPKGLAADGAQTEGATFWASTMHYRLFYMDALRRVTGRDLFKDYAQYMSADLALAAVAAQKQPGWNESHQSVILEPPYGQLDYYAPILLYLAGEYRRPECQYLAMWDHPSDTSSKRGTLRRTARSSSCLNSAGMPACGTTRPSSRTSPAQPCPTRSQA